MKMVIGFAFILCTIFSSAYADDGRHFVFLVHGIGAGPNSFGASKELLTAEAKTQDKNREWYFTHFNYQTGNYGKDVFVFARELNDFIQKTFKDRGGLRKEDKFSLILHSQGSIIGLRLLIDSFSHQKGFTPGLIDHLDAFITLASPFWGSKVAIFAGRMMPILAYLNIPLPGSFGMKELEDMELASDYSAYSRGILIDPKNAEALDKIKKQVRFLSIAAVTERLNILAPISSGKNRYEDDTAVPIPSSRMDFIYYKDSSDSRPDVVESSEFKSTNMIDPSNYVVVNAFHSSPFPENLKFPGIAQMPAHCLNKPYRECIHPSYMSVVQHLFKLEKDPVFVRDLSSFAIDLKLNTNGAKLRDRDLIIDFKALTNGLKIGNDIEIYNKVTRWSKTGNYRLYHTGYIDPKLTTASSGKVELTINVAHHKPRKIIVPVKAVMSTFVELDLEKID